MNETTEQTRGGGISPRPWHTERREYVTIDKRGWKAKKKGWFLVDANGKDVPRTELNMRHVCACVNNAYAHFKAYYEADRDEIMENQLMYP